MTTVIHSARLVDDGEVTDDAWVAFADGVALTAERFALTADAPAADAATDAPEKPKRTRREKADADAQPKDADAQA